MDNFKVTRISSLEKVRTVRDIHNEVGNVTLFKGETYSYQIVTQSKERCRVQAEVDSPLDVLIYVVDNAVVDFPYVSADIDGGYLTYEPCLMPDILTPVSHKSNNVTSTDGIHTFWVQIDVPEECVAGEYRVDIKLTQINLNDQVLAEEHDVLGVSVKDKTLPEQEVIVTQWLHTDCIASVHHCEVYSERHWQYIEKYIKTAAELGNNMIYTPIISPPLDTAKGAQRPNVQLVKVKRKGEEYEFDFSLVRRWIELCNNNGIKYFEMAHLFSQGGAIYSPNIYAEENGEEVLIFGWHIKANDESYKKFLAQLLPQLIQVFREYQMEEKVYFHISDEPTDEHLKSYENAYQMVKPYIGNCKTFDALSHYDFYERGLVATPVCNTLEIESFVEHEVENLWAYYCCGGYRISNRFLAMPAYRNRVIGIQLYKFGIKGFLHWGFNFYYSAGSLYTINPYITTSCDKNFPSGDPFVVYPHEEGPLKSMRAIVFQEALQDILICRMLEEKIGRKKVVAMIDEFAGEELTFKQFPADTMFVPDLINKIKEMI